VSKTSLVRKNNSIARKGRERKDIGFLEELSNKPVEVVLINGDLIYGVLQSNPYNRYEIKIEDSNGIHVICKHYIAYIKEVRG